MSNLPVLFVLSIACLIISCNNSSSSKEVEDCPYGSPVGIFSKELPDVVAQEFKLNGLEGVEYVQFSNGIKLELIQSGCEKIQQEFRFTLQEPVQSSDPEIWAEFAIQIFNYMGRLDVSLSQFSFWSQAFEELRSDLSPGNAVQLEAGRWVKLDGINSSDHSILIVILSQQES